ncbi:hypothetical protein [Brevundimonas sp.]|jgi:hypothetical protein|uniref:hypothetical protein n=1 Tax=Brevundimonas sp. TaxID=1871086 RepID=UPI003785316D
MTLETASPEVAAPAAVAGDQTTADQLATAKPETEGQAEQDGEPKNEQAKPEKTPEQRERERMQRGIDRKTRQAAEARAEAEHLRQELSRLRGEGAGATNRTPQDEDDTVSLSRAELAEMVKSEAAKLAPTLKQQQAEIEQMQKVAQSLQKELGEEGFEALASDLDDALGGALTSGKPSPVIDAIFSADDPQAVIKYLADPDNDAEAEVIGRMSAVQAGRAIAKLELKLAEAKARDKPQRSKAPEPIEPARASGAAASSEPDTSKWTDDQWIKWRQTNRK